MVIAKIHVTLKASVLDPQGVAVTGALHHMGHKEVKGVRIGKYMEIKLDEKGQTTAQLEKKVKQMCEKLLANTQIESYEFSLKKAK
jgi:phosphoribosylformylglycinamidine synthase PurS subunit